MRIEKIIERAFSGTGCDKQTALLLVEKYPLDELKKAANQVKMHFFGNRVRLCSIINAKSGVCEMDCRFCSQSVRNSADPPVYPFLSTERLAGKMRKNNHYHVHNCGIVTSGGKLSSHDVDTFIQAVKKVCGTVSFQICASFGRVSDSDMEKLKKAGINRLHHNLETSRNFYPRICSTQSWDSRMETVQAALSKGMKVCCGGLFGLGESWADRIDLAVAIAGSGIDSVPINFLHPHPGTPLAGKGLLSAEDALRIIAVYRLILPDRTIRICGGRTTVLKDRQHEVFSAGANAIMTGDYLTTAGQSPETDKMMIKSQGLVIERL